MLGRGENGADPLELAYLEELSLKRGELKGVAGENRDWDNLLGLGSINRRLRSTVMGGGMGAKGTRLVPSLDRYHQSASSSSLTLVRSVLPLWSFLQGLGKMGKETDRDGAGDPGGPLPADFLGENIPAKGEKQAETVSS